MSKLGALHLSKHTGVKHSATVIFFHGSGSSGADMKEWVRLMVKNMAFPHIKVMYPTAPLQPYSPAGGQMSNVWFDRAGISPDVPEKLESLNNIEIEIKNLIQNENNAGIPSNRIIVGGFSMGGALALHTAYRWDKNVAGVFAFGSFLNKQSVVYQELKNTPTTQINRISVSYQEAVGVFYTVPPLIQIHGDSDDLVNLNWGQDTFDQLKHLGVQGEFYIMQKLGHAINKRGMVLIKEWIEKHLPEV